MLEIAEREADGGKSCIPVWARGDGGCVAALLVGRGVPASVGCCDWHCGGERLKSPRPAATAVEDREHAPFLAGPFGFLRVRDAGAIPPSCPS